MLLNPIAFAESLIFRALVTSSYQHVAAFSQLQVIQRRRQAGHKCSASSFYNTVVPQCSTVFTDPLPSKDKFKTWTLNRSNWWSSWGSRSTGIMEIKSCAVLVYNYCLYHYSPAFHLWLLQQWHWVTSGLEPGLSISLDRLLHRGNDTTLGDFLCTQSQVVELGKCKE